MKKDDSYSNKTKLVKRLKKIEGQVKGIQRMIEDDKYCADVLIQIAAVKAAINKVGLLILRNHSHACISRAIKENKEEMVEDLINVLEKFIK